MLAAILFGVTLVGPARCVIAIVPVGEVAVARLEELSVAVEKTFGCRVELATGIPLPASAWDSTRHQYRSTAILDALARRKRPDWERLLAVADVDLYAPELNFVFGEADSRRGVAVFSLARLHGATERKRAETEAIHELGHTYGLSHCDDPKCVMWFSNTLSETDRKGSALCARHARDLARAKLRADS